MTFILTCNNRPVLSKNWIIDDEVIIHSLTDSRGAAYHRNVIIEEALKKGIKQFWVCDDDINSAYVPGDKQSKGYYKKIKSKIDLRQIQFPPDTGIGGLIKSDYPWKKITGFTSSYKYPSMIIWLNFDVLGDYRYPEGKGFCDDGDLGVYCLAYNLPMRRAYQFCYGFTRIVSEFNYNDTTIWLDLLKRCKENYDKYPTEGLMKLWKATLKGGPWTTESKEVRHNYYSIMEDKLKEIGVWLPLKEKKFKGFNLV
jgi:hypothetical protein